MNEPRIPLRYSARAEVSWRAGRRRRRRGRHTATTLPDVVELLVERCANGHELCGVVLLRGRELLAQVLELCGVVLLRGRELLAQDLELEENVVDGGR